MRVVEDQMGRVVNLPSFPKRIVSLVPSQTELLVDLGLEDRIVGITKFCIHPDNIYRSKMRVGGTKQYHFDRIKALNPDLIIGNKEENDKEQITQLTNLYPVWMSDIKNLDDALHMIRALGDITQTKSVSSKLVLQIEETFSQLKSKTLTPIKAAYLIWRKPWMSIGHDTFIHEMMRLAGFQNVCHGLTRYPVLSDDEIIGYEPEVILLSSEPFPFKEKHIEELKNLCPKATIILVNGELFSWYGSRLLNTPTYFLELRKQIIG